MKKIYTFIAVLLLGATIQAQQIATFDDLTLQPDSFWNGSDLTGGFSDGGVYFINYYDTSYGGFWNGGFVYSNKTDSVTAGLLNEYSVMAGHAYSGNNFAVVNPGSFNTTYVKLPLIEKVTGIFVTNSSYAYISMRDGDAYAKKFGGTSGNDSDWFKLTVLGYNGTTFTDSSEFYLADFRFADNTQDYILKDWMSFDLIGLGYVDSLVFVLSSSDVGAYGMNTPAFFCIDDLTVDQTGLEFPESQTALNIYPNPVSDILKIQSASRILSIKLMSLQGKQLKKVQINQSFLNMDISNLPVGIYLVEVITEDNVLTRKIIKK